MQPTKIGLGTSCTDSSILRLDYTYDGTTTNNGNVLTQTITIGSTVMSQSYNYDSLNRLSSATESGAWTQTYDCDRYGNRALRNTSYIPTPALTPQSVNSTDFSAFNQSTNGIALGGFGYNPSGNLTGDPTTGANAILYDAENHQTSYSKAGVTTNYAYDGDGRRVKKVAGGVTTVFVYNVAGQLIAEYDNSTAPPPAGGTSYLTTDHLGSTRVVTDSGGTVKGRYDYLPFGEEISSSIGGRSSVVGYGGADSTRQKFTQKERDSESDLDFFGARYYSSAQARFTSVDPSMSSADRSLPQSWNRYSYVLNSPLVMVDPNGEEWYRLNKDDGNLYYFEGNGEREGYTLVHLGPSGRDITNMQGATGQFAHFNGHNVTLTDAGIIDRGLYIAPPAPDLPDGSEWAGNMLLQFAGVSIVGGLILPEAAGGLMLLNATAATLTLLKEQDASIQGNIEASLQADRQAGVNAAWRQEAELVRQTGHGTVNWTPQEMEELLRTGRVGGYEGHHINSINGHPEMARDPSNVRFVRGRAEHLGEHGGNFRNQTEGPLEPRIIPKP